MILKHGMITKKKKTLCVIIIIQFVGKKNVDDNYILIFYV